MSKEDKGEHGHSEVEITVDDVTVKIHRGRRSVSEIKDAGNVPQTYDLDQVVDGRLEPLSDDGSVTIKGNEVFVSHVKDSSSS